VLTESESRSSISIETSVGPPLDWPLRGVLKIKYVVGNKVNATTRLMTILVGVEAVIATYVSTAIIRVSMPR